MTPICITTSGFWVPWCGKHPWWQWYCETFILIFATRKKCKTFAKQQPVGKNLVVLTIFMLPTYKSTAVNDKKHNYWCPRTNNLHQLSKYSMNPAFSHPRRASDTCNRYQITQSCGLPVLAINTLVILYKTWSASTMVYMASVLDQLPWQCIQNGCLASGINTGLWAF